MVLARQYFLLTFALGVALVVGITSWELWKYHKFTLHESQQLDERISLVYKPSLISSLRSQNSDQLQETLNAMVKLDAIERVRIFDAYADWQAGEDNSSIEPELLVPLSYGEKPNQLILGKLALTLERRGHGRDLLSTGLSLFLYSAAKTLVMLGFSLVFFHMLVSRYVVTIDYHLRNLNPEKGVQLLRFPPRRLARGRNEFDSVVATINILNYRLVESVRELRLHGAQLEQRVVERTQALENANERALRNERLTAIGQLVGKVSHELRNPMGTIQASLALLQRGGMADEALHKSAIARMERNIERCDKLVRELLIYSQLPADPVDWVALDSTVQSIVDEHQISIDAKSSLTFAAQSSASVWIIPEQLNRLLSNLIDNAVDAVGSRQNGRIHVETSFENDSAVLTVVDNGSGISAEVRERIFEPMFSTKSFGFGFGLSVVMQVVQSSEAEIQIENLNPGTRFIVRFNRGTSAILG